MKKQIAFLCTANYYRSRFAEHFFNWLASQHRLPWQAGSRGLQVGQWGNIGPIAEWTVLRLKSHGIIVPEPHREPMPLTLDDLHAFDHVVAVKEAEHRPQMKLQFPAWCDRVEYWHVDDLDCATPEDSLPLLEIQVQALVERLAKAAHQSARPTSAASSHAPANKHAAANRPANLQTDGRPA